MPGFIFYEGPSVLDGSPIIGVAIDSSANRKTGAMIQTYILRSDVSPIDAAAEGEDASVCGDCKHRPSLDGACYVNLGHGPTAVWNGLMRDIYPMSLLSAARMCEGRKVRLGSYGDPMAIPWFAWYVLVAGAVGHTGYTHQWMNPDIAHIQREGIMALCMASVDTPTEADMAHTLGYRTFRVRTRDEPMLAGEFVCPASDEAGKRLQCADCLACNGGVGMERKASPVIIAHGSKARRFYAILNAA